MLPSAFGEVSAFTCATTASTSLRIGGVFLVEQLVDADDQLRDRAEPRKLRIVEQRIQQIVARLTPVNALVSAALPIEQRLVQTQKRLAKIAEQLFRLPRFRDIVIGHRRLISHYA